MEIDAASKRKSGRLSKKPKILDEYVIDSSQDSLISKSQLHELDNNRLPQKEKSCKPKRK